MNYEITGKGPVRRSRYGYSLGSGRDVTPCAFWKKLAVLLGIAVMYVAVQLWISWPSIKWLMGGAS